jgi:hypothetical protein
VLVAVDGEEEDEGVAEEKEWQQGNGNAVGSKSTNPYVGNLHQRVSHVTVNLTRVS